ncbi:MAG TPA: 2-amino-4-hydroxy-6-hydroxymethyldihydropteridine diphosphokinase [Candidatus Saccharimonadales bacterium]
MTRVYLALGSNVGDTAAHIRQAIELLRPLLDDLKQAPLYRTKAVGYTDQADFCNTAVSGLTDLEPPALLSRLKDIERKVGRTPTFRHGPREIDIDIIFYGDQRLASPDLTIPHPQFAARDFVLQPLADLEPSFTDPLSGQTVQALLAQLGPQQKSIIQKVDADA